MLIGVGVVVVAAAVFERRQLCYLQHRIKDMFVGMLDLKII